MVRRPAVEDRPHPDTGRPRRTAFFLLRAPDDAPDVWLHQVRGEDGDAGLTFACRFLRLPLATPLADGQDVWPAPAGPSWSAPSQPSGPAAPDGP
ncbi:hypothetical protein Sdia_46170 [Streptomyces diastaticus subsp. diastaticus]|uniref:Uncharacterized protein n=1 Tax=Streptomyces diastaticus subsp. diastaticus TaxID=68040 RepID=A0ABQ1CUF1_STRDI|nr:hypothetical protein Sdia_46170 [Streptomyces diastaticus subsp. diastaticus]GGU06828.1 hypothetical protein GCM10015534_05810 [Streptomyces diastaticus subsp. diastaticus]